MGSSWDKNQQDGVTFLTQTMERQVEAIQQVVEEARQERAEVGNICAILTECMYLTRAAV